MEMILPGARTNEFLNSLVHPSLTTTSDFLGYEQPRPKAPFAYANAWGNNLGLLLPYFVYSAWTDRTGLVAVAVPARPRPAQRGRPREQARCSSSLSSSERSSSTSAAGRARWSRCSWASPRCPWPTRSTGGSGAGIALTVVAGAIALLRTPSLHRALALGVAVAVAAVIVVASPLWATITLRLETPHSNDRRLDGRGRRHVDDVGGLTAPRLRHHPQGGGQLRLDRRGVEPELPPVRRATARHAGLHVAAHLHHGFRRDGPVHGIPGWSSSSLHIRRKEAMCLLGCITLVTSVHVLLRLRLARDPAVHR